MRAALFTLLLSASPAFAGWNLDTSQAIAPGTNHDGFAVDWSWSTAVSPFERGPQLESTNSLTLGNQQDFYRLGLGLRQELNPSVALSAHALWARLDGDSRAGAQAALSTKLWRHNAPGYDHGMGLGLYVYGGMSPAPDDNWWWSGAGLQLAFGK
jgi:hypothetical protein